MYSNPENDSVWDFAISCLTSEDVCWEDLRWSEIRGINNIVWLSAFWLLDPTNHGDTESEQKMLPSLPLGCDSPQAVMGIAWSHAATLNLLLCGRSSLRCFVGIHHLGVTGLEECTCCRCTGGQWVISPLRWGQLWHQSSGELCSWCPQVTLDFWLSEQTAAGQQGVKLSAHLLIRPEESYSAHQHTGLCHVLSFSFLSFSQQVLTHSTQRECVWLMPWKCFCHWQICICGNLIDGHYFFLVLQCFIYSLRFFMVKNQWWNNFWMMEEKVVIGSPYQYNSYFCFVFLLFGQSGDAGANPCCLGLKGTFTSWTSF